MEQKFNKILSLADVQINGSRPWDIQIHNKKVFARILKEGSFGLGESYVDEWWSCEALDQLIYKITRIGLHERFEAPFKLFKFLQHKFANMQSKKGLPRLQNITMIWVTNFLNLCSIRKCNTPVHIGKIMIP